MRAWMFVGCVALLGIVGLGCQHSEEMLRPPQMEEYNIPPKNDGRFAKPFDNYPDRKYESATRRPAPNIGMPNMGGPAGPGMGGAGMGAPAAAGVSGFPQ